MTTWRRLGLAAAAGAILLLGIAPPGALAKAKTTTTTTTPVVRSPMDEPIGSKNVVNSWAVAPAGQSSDPSQPSERPFFTYSAVPGQVIHDAVTLYNYSNVPLTFRLYATDAFNNAEGGFDVLPGDKKPKDVGTWITVEQESIALPAKREARVPVTVHIPADASPGDHAGAVLASSVATGTGPDGKFVNVDRRTGARVYVRVAGLLTPQLAITKVSHTYHPALNPFSGRTDVTYRIENHGNVRLAGKHRVSVSGLLGLGRKQGRFSPVPELLPGQGFDVKASFKGLPATFVDFATVDVEPNTSGGKVVSTVNAGAATVAVPWTIVALVMMAFLLVRARRAYRGHEEDAGGGLVQPGPQPV
jgi:hypothetical protein